jgi:hypothetical protein
VLAFKRGFHCFKCCVARLDPAEFYVNKEELSNHLVLEASFEVVDNLAAFRDKEAQNNHQALVADLLVASVGIGRDTDNFVDLRT